MPNRSAIKIPIREPLCINFKLVNSPSNFVASIGIVHDFGDFAKYFTKLRNWCDENFNYYNKISPMDLKIGQYVVVKYNCDAVLGDHVWRRAKIISIDEIKETVNVFFIDEGFSQLCTLDQIFKNLPEFFDRFDAQAKKCHLKDARPQNDNGSGWSEEAISYFRSIIDQDGLTVTYLEKIENENHILSSFECEYIVEIHTNKKVNLLNMLISSGHAKMTGIACINVDSQMHSELVMTNSFNRGISSSESSSQSSLVSSQMNRSQDPAAVELMDDEDDDDEFKFVYSKTNESISKVPANSSANTSLVIVGDKSANDDEIIECDSDPKSTVHRKKIKMSNSINVPNDENQKELVDLESELEEGEAISLDEDEPDDLYSCKFDDNTGATLTTQTFICSDDTILTGYRTNINVDENQLGRDIKIANIKRTNLAKGIETILNIPKSEALKSREKSGNIEERIYEILSNNTGAYCTIESRTNGIVNVFKESPNKSSLIIKCILKEMALQNLRFPEGIALINTLRFCKASIFLKGLEMLISENEPLYMDPSYDALADKNREKLCRLLAMLYQKACESDEYKFLNNVPNYCSGMAKEWISIYENKDVASFIYVRNFRSIKDFLRVCIEHFKHYDHDILAYIFQKASKYSQDHTISKDVRKESYAIVLLYAETFVNVRSSLEIATESKDKDESIIVPIPPEKFKFSLLSKNKTEKNNNNNKRKSSEYYHEPLIDLE